MQDSEQRRFFVREMLLGRLYVFSGTFPLKAVGPVCADHELTASDVKTGLQMLEDEGLIVRHKAHGGTRLTLWFEDVDRWRAEAYQRKAMDSVRDRHLAFFVSYLEKLQPKMRSDSQDVTLEQFQRDLDNTRAALTWSLRDAADSSLCLRLLAATFRFWHLRAHQSEGLSWVQEALRKAKDRRDLLKLKCLNMAGSLQSSLGQLRASERSLTQALNLANELGYERGAAIALANRAMVHQQLGRHPIAHREFQKALAAIRTLDEPAVLADALSNYSVLTTKLGWFDDSIRLLEEARDIELASGDLWSVLNSDINLADIYLAQGDGDRAEKLYVECLLSAQSFNDTRTISILLGSLAETAARNDRYRRAAALIGAAAFTAELVTTDAPEGELDRILKAVGATRDALGEDEFDEHWQHGYAMTVEEAVAFATAPPS